MKLQDALNLFGLQPGASQDEIKAAYKQAALKYHPDHNPAGLEMMKAINNAMDRLRDYDGSQIKGFQAEAAYADSLNEALNKIITLNLHIEICGAWIWVTGQTKAVKQTLKDAGFFWAPQKEAWYYRPKHYRSSSRGKYSLWEIREKFGSRTVKEAQDLGSLAS